MVLSLYGTSQSVFINILACIGHQSFVLTLALTLSYYPQGHSSYLSVSFDVSGKDVTF